MAGPEPSTTRRRVLGAAAILPVLALVPNVLTSAATQSHSAQPTNALWNRRLDRYRRLATEAEQAATTGWFRAANDRYHREMAAIEALRVPRIAQEENRIQRLRRAAFKRIDRAEKAYWHRCTAPMQAAAIALILTPAPDLAALGTKLAVIRAHVLHELGSMTRDCFEVLEKDVRSCSDRTGRSYDLY